MRIHALNGLALIVLFAISSSPAVCQTKKTKKPAQKTTQTKLGTLGTAQLPGEQCELGKTYTIGKDDPLNFTLNKVEYRVSRFMVDKTFQVCAAQDKFLIFHFTLQNPSPRTIEVNNPFTFSAVTPTDQNVDSIFVYLEQTKLSLGQELKPGQKIDCFSFVHVPAEGQVPKLMVANRSGVESPVARYDLRGKVEKLVAPYVDTKDPSGATALGVIPAKMGDVCDLGRIDLTVTKLETTTQQLPVFSSDQLEEDAGYVLVSVTIKNFNPDRQALSLPCFKGELIDADGGTIEAGNRFLRSSTLAEFPGDVAYEGQVNGRFYFYAQKGVTYKTLRVSIDGCRPYEISLNDVKL